MRHEGRRLSLFPGSTPEQAAAPATPLSGSVRAQTRRVPWFRVAIIAICVMILRGLRYLSEEPNHGSLFRSEDGHSSYGQLLANLLTTTNATSVPGQPEHRSNATQQPVQKPLNDTKERTPAPRVEREESSVDKGGSAVKGD
eukprot:TRINITY_DN37640_c0_g1_i1.p1 TRINITY_DN37640_c0_g1~~TRINITY_DN37640_c0_g1_i1.p1  ORF type:complete len:142 (+),score=3.61 TRINITY_DN37640_c0_g1_i1:45-470(+)